MPKKSTNEELLIKTVSDSYALAHDARLESRENKKDNKAFKQHLQRQNGDITKIKVEVTEIKTNVKWLMWFNGIMTSGMAGIFFKLFFQ